MLPILVQTKLSIPPRSSALVPRPHLIRQLDDGIRAGHKLFLVTAPAGSGKTTLLSEWAHNAERSTPAGPSFCWVSLDEQDNDPLLFWSYLFAALETRQPGIAEAARVLLQGEPLKPTPIELALAVLINTLSQESALSQESDRCALILDDYHVIDNPFIHTAFVYLLEHLPSQLHLALASRSEPPLELARLRARGQLTELRVDALSFAESEAAAFLNSAMGLDLSPDEIAMLKQRTEGWIAGLQLAAIALRSTRRPDADGFVETFSGTHRHVVDYFTSEVLQRQEPDVQAFLLQTCILERLTASLCDQVRGDIGSSQPMLEYLERSNLFLLPLDAERCWYRYHSLWADVLRARLLHEQPEQSPLLHQRASVWFEQHGFLAEAFSHALQAGEAERAASLLEPAARAMVLRGESSTLLSWLEKLDPAIVDSRPDLLIAQAWAWIIAGQIEKIEPALSTLASRPGISFALQGEIAALRALIATIHQDIAAIQRQAALALQYLPLEDNPIRCMVALSLGTAAALSGDETMAVELLNQAVQESQRSNQRILSLVATSTLAQTYEALGQLDQAARSHRQIMALETDPVLGKLPLIGIGYVGLGGVLHKWLRFEEAEATLNKGLDIGQHWGSPEILIGGYFSLAHLRYTQGDLDGALKILDKLEAEFPDAIPLRERVHILAERAHLWLAQGKIALAETWAQTCGLDESAPIAYTDERQWLILVRVWLARHEPAMALQQLARLEHAARAGQRVSSLIEILLLQALAHQAQNHSRLALGVLDQALALAEPQNHQYIFLNEPELLSLVQVYVSGHLQNRFAADLLPHFERRAALLKPLVLLSERELDVLRLIAAGLSNQEIAEHLVVALSTVKSHVKSILLKLDVQNRTQAVARGRKLGLL
jgi:LuxR family maltose regulon positive regulatory protein